MNTIIKILQGCLLVSISVLISCQSKHSKAYIENDVASPADSFEMKDDQNIQTDTVSKYSMVSDDGFFLMDNSGNKIYEIFPYDNGPDYVSEGLQRIIKDGKIGYGDPILGKVIIQPIYSCAYPFENGRAKVSIDCTTITDGEHSIWESKEWMYIDKNGNKVKD
ncbi:MAG: WG repeat-containing protein [Saprospiraceae bacterium]|nr:WG repeat-containing protein [Candidatus Brachybacter algidus]